MQSCKTAPNTTGAGAQVMGTCRNTAEVCTHRPKQGISLTTKTCGKEIGSRGMWEKVKEGVENICPFPI